MIYWFIVILFASGVSAQDDPAALNISTRSDNLQAFSSVIHARGGYLRAIAKARLLAAEAELKFAQAQFVLVKTRQQWEFVKQLQLFTRQMNINFRKLNLTDRQLENQTERIEGLVRRVARLKVCRIDQTVYTAFNNLIQTAVPADILFEEMGMPLENEVNQDDFLVTSRSPDDLIPFEGETVGGLFRYLEDNILSMKKYSPVHLQIIKTLGQLSGAAENKIVEIQSYRESILDRTLDIWNPPDLNDAIRLPNGFRNVNNF